MGFGICMFNDWKLRFFSKWFIERGCNIIKYAENKHFWLSKNDQTAVIDFYINELFEFHKKSVLG